MVHLSIYLSIHTYIYLYLYLSLSLYIYKSAHRWPSRRKPGAAAPRLGR